MGEPTAPIRLLRTRDHAPPARQGLRVPRRGRRPGRRPRGARHASASWGSRRPGRTSGSARIRTATSRPPASTRPAASSTCTTSAGARGATPRSSTTWSRFAHALPRPARARGRAISTATSSTRERVLACAVRLLDRGFFRIGSEDYAESERELRPGDDAQAARHARPASARWSSTTPPRAASGACSRSSTRVARRRGRAQAAPRRRRRAARVQGRPPLARRPLRRHQRVRQGRRPAATSRPRTSAPGTPPCWPPSRWRSSGEAAGTKTGRKRAIAARDQGGRPLPRQHAGGVPRVLHRPARVRRLPGRAGDRKPRDGSTSRSTTARWRRRCST